MMFKCILTLAVVYQVAAYKCNQENTNVKPTEQIRYEYSYPTQNVGNKYRIIATTGYKTSGLTSQNAAYGRNLNASPLTRSFVARGKYPVTLQTCGPMPDKKIPIVTSHIRTPVQEKPTVRLQSKIPAPKTISHTCTCFKTIVKPKVQQHLITVPTIQRYIETLHKPVIENIHYEAYPVKCLGSTDNENTEDKEKTQIQTIQIEPVESRRIQPEKIQTIEIPRVQTIQLSNERPKTQIIQIPRIQFIEAQQGQKIEIPLEGKKLQTVEIPLQQFLGSQKTETIKIPQFFQEKKCENSGISNGRFVESNKAQTIQLPRFEFVEAQKATTMEIPRIQVEESPKLQTVGIPQGGTITLGTNPFAYQFNQ